MARPNNAPVPVSPRRATVHSTVVSDGQNVRSSGVLQDSQDATRDGPSVLGHSAQSRPPVDPPSAAPGGLLTIREAAAMLRIGDSTIRNAIRSGQLRAFRFGARGGSIRIATADLEEYIAGCATAKPLCPKAAPTTVGGRFKHLDASKLLSAWRQQGVLGAPRDGNNAPSSECSDAPSTQKGS